LTIASAFKPMYNVTRQRKAIGSTMSNFLYGCIGAKRSSTLSSCGGFFQNTCDHILAITNSVTKLPKSNAAAKKYCCWLKASWNKKIFGQKPDNGGMPTKENNTTAVISSGSPCKDPQVFPFQACPATAESSLRLKTYLFSPRYRGSNKTPCPSARLW